MTSRIFQPEWYEINSEYKNLEIGQNIRTSDIKVVISTHWWPGRNGEAGTGRNGEAGIPVAVPLPLDLCFSTALEPVLSLEVTTLTG